MRILSSEWLKTKGTAIRWITFCMPALVSLCIVAYLGLRPDLAAEWVYQGFFLLWTGVVLPVFSGLLAGFLVREEEMAGNFHGLLKNPVSRVKLYMGKFAMLLLCTLAASLMATGILCLKVGNQELFFSAALLAALGALPVLALHLWIGFLWGMGAAIGVGMCGILLAMLLGASGLGGNLWMAVPWTWPVKMSMLPLGFRYMDRGLAADQLLLEVLLAVGAFLVFLALGSFWFSRWEGKRSGE